MEASLRTVPLFAELSDADLARIEDRSTAVRLDDGEVLFREGDAGDSAFVITGGEIEIIKQTGTREVLLAVRKPGDVIGEMALLQDAPRSATARASGASTLTSIPRAEIDALMATSAEAVRALFRVLLERWRSTQALLAQNERMIQLGTLTAGLAHEMNNPAAGAQRAATQLRTAVDELAAAERALAKAVSGERADALAAIVDEADDGGQGSTLGSLALADLEADIEDTLTDAGIEDAWRLAPAIAETGAAGTIDEILERSGAEAPLVLRTIVARHGVGSLVHQIEEGTRRLASLVKALKGYSYLDQAPVQQVDVQADIEDTLLILGAKLTGIEVERDYEEGLEPIQAYGAALNQVWTNLLDNAADAIEESGRDDGRITISVKRRDDLLVVEIGDNGVRIPAEAIPRLFDAFFTTKPPGKGTGQGLNISYGIIVHNHRGKITIDQTDDHKIFRVEIPVTVDQQKASS